MVVRFDEGRIRVASLYVKGGWRAVLTVVIDILLSEDGRQVSLDLVEVRGGSLNLPRPILVRILDGPAIGDAGTANLSDWVSKGGVLIGVGNANRYLADANIDITSIRRENAVVEENGEGGSSGGNGDNGDEPMDATVEGSYLTSADDYKAAIAAEKAEPDYMGGVLIRADVDPDHWLGAGVSATLNVLVRGSDIYTPIQLDSGVNVVRFQAADDLLASGYIWEENRKQLAFKPFVVAQPQGRGFVISFTQDPNVRAYLDGLNVIFANAIFRGAAHARPMH